MQELRSYIYYICWYWLIVVFFLSNSYPCVLFVSLSYVINQESHVNSWNLGKIYLVHFLKFWNLPRFTREIWKFQKSELGKFIPNFPLKHVITSTNLLVLIDCFLCNSYHCVLFQSLSHVINQEFVTKFVDIRFMIVFI